MNGVRCALLVMSCVLGAVGCSGTGDGGSEPPTGNGGTVGTGASGGNGAVGGVGGGVTGGGGHVGGTGGATGGEAGTIELRRKSRITVGGSHACVITSERTVQCWGTGDSTIDSAEGDGWDQVWANGSSTCALKLDGTLWCWGPPGLTDPTGTYSWATLNGWDYVCALRSSDGGVECWGNEGTIPTGAPTTSLSSVGCDLTFCCGVEAATGLATCWGSTEGGMRDPTNDSLAILSAGETVVCGLTPTGNVRCWGVEACTARTPTGQFTDVSAGGCVGCALDPAGEVTCWGNSPIPGGIAAGPYIDIATGPGYMCGIRPDGTVACSGGIPNTPTDPIALTAD